ncbi:MAG: ATP-binding protein [Dysgonamonadaceae bacterium]|jgi:predicted ATPase|nr:ATP-binding protein [Dysgonamonadaceae bacterium]
MTKVTIRNVGPIANVEINLNKINIIAGPQSSGKSTVAKIISYCQWVEKRSILDGKYNENVIKQLLGFHHLNNYFAENSFFEYESDFIIINYRGSELKESIQFKNEIDVTHYERSKNIYIPSERNFVSSISNLGKYNETNDNIMSFLYDWYTAKKKFTKQNSLPILNLGIQFYNNQASDSDMLILNDTQKEIFLRASSSGMQSITPLVLIVEYLTDKIFKEDHPFSMNEVESIKDILNDIFESKYVNARDKSQQISKETIEEETKNFFSALEKRRRQYHRTHFIIEEPEQNLFPETQRDLIYYLFNKMTSERQHSLLITTHSPYILYAINNCLMAGVVYGKMSETDKRRLDPNLIPFDPQEISIYQLSEGKIHCIQQEDNLIGDNYFDSKMKDIMDDFYVMLNYYGNDNSEH